MNKKRVISMTLACILSISLLTGCGASGKNAQSTKSKTLIYAQGAEPLGLDPVYVSDGEAAKVTDNVCEGLVKFKSGTTDIEPALAESWEVSKDGKEYIFHLRKGVKFHDGTEFNADAAVFNLERQLPPNAEASMPYANFCYGQVDKVIKVDDSTIKITLKKPFTPFLKNLALSLGAAFVSPKSIKDNNGKNMESAVGTGPFKFVKWDKGQSITIEKNNDYWGSKAKVDKVVFKFIKENSVRAQELIAGSADIIDGIDPNIIKTLEDNKMNVLKQDGMNINYMAFNCSRAPFDDPKVRQAISYAIDRKELVKYLYCGYAEVAKSPIPDFIPGFNGDMKQYEYNPEKAKQLLKEAGKENLTIKMLTYTNSRPYNSVGGQKLAETIQNYLAKIGVKAEIDACPWTDFLTKMKQGEGDITFVGWIGINGDADTFMSIFGSNQIDAGLNMARYKSTKVDELIAKGQMLKDGPEREKVYKDIQNILAEDAPWVSISHATDMAAVSPKVKNFKLQPSGMIYLSDVDVER